MSGDEQDRPVIVSVADVEPVDNPKTRWDLEGVVVKPLLNESVGAEQYWLVHSEYPPSSGHRPHRHPKRDQAIYILSGSLLFTDGSGVTRRLNAGEVVHLPAGEWHSFDNDGEVSAFTLGLQGGTGSPQGGGYERREDGGSS